MLFSGKARIAGTFLALILVAIGSAAEEAAVVYTVRPGDTLIALSEQVLVRPQAWGEVARLNGLPNPDVIVPGQRLRLPLRLLKAVPAGARLVSVTGEVRLDQNEARVGQVLAEGARLQSGPQGSAVLELADGSRVQLLPSSVAELTTHREYRVPGPDSARGWFAGLMRLVQGSVETLARPGVARATPLQVQTPTALVGVRGTRFRVAHEPGHGDRSRAEVLDGRVRADHARRAGGADLDRGTGAVVEPDRAGVVAVPLLPAPDLTPLPAEVTPDAPDWPMPTPGDAVAWRVQVARDPGFEQIVRDLRSAGPSVALADLATGVWHVRVRGIDARGLEGFDAARSVAVREAVQPVLRVGDARLHWHAGQTRLRLALSTADGTPLPGPHRLVLARDADLARVLTRAEGPAGTLTEFTLGPLVPGFYQLQIETTLGTGRSLHSPVFQLEVHPNWGATVFDADSPLLVRPDSHPAADHHPHRP